MHNLQTSVTFTALVLVLVIGVVVILLADGLAYATPTASPDADTRRGPLVPDVADEPTGTLYYSAASNPKPSPRPRNPEGGPVVDILGHVHVGDEQARVVWTSQGDAVALDFTRDSDRYGIVVGLDTDRPRLLVEPRYQEVIGPVAEVVVLNHVMRVWSRT